MTDPLLVIKVDGVNFVAALEHLFTRFMAAGLPSTDVLRGAASMTGYSIGNAAPDFTTAVVGVDFVSSAIRSTALARFSERQAQAANARGGAGLQ